MDLCHGNQALSSQLIHFFFNPLATRAKNIELCYNRNMMMVSGISIRSEYVPAVVVPPIVMPHIDKTQTSILKLQPVQASTAAAFKLHRSPFDRSLQDSYDMHGKMVQTHKLTGTQLNRLI